MRLLALVTILLLSGCGLGSDSLYTASIAEKNVDNLARVNIGMDQKSVVKIMRRPYESESFQVNGDTYELWYYVTGMTAMGQTRMVPQNLTPLAFKNGVLVGWGYEYYRWLTREQNLEKKPSAKPAQEDKPLEKTLEPTPPSKAPPLKILTMSKAPKKPEPPPEKKPLLSPEDEEMLEQESEQNFNQNG